MQAMTRCEGEQLDERSGRTSAPPPVRYRRACDADLEAAEQPDRHVIAADRSVLLDSVAEMLMHGGVLSSRSVRRRIVRRGADARIGSDYVRDGRRLRRRR